MSSVGDAGSRGYGSVGVGPAQNIQNAGEQIRAKILQIAQLHQRISLGKTVLAGEGQLRSLNMEISKKGKEIGDHVTRAENQAHQVLGLKSHVAELETRLALMREKNRALQQKVQANMETKNESSGALDHRKQQIVDLHRVVEQKERERERIQGALGSKRGTIQGLHVRDQDAQREISRLKGVVSERELRIDDLFKNLGAQQRVLEQFQKKLEQKRGEEQTLRSQVQDDKAELSRLGEDITQHEHRLGGLKKEDEVLQQNLRKFQGEFDSKFAEMRTAADTMGQLTTEERKLREQIDHRAEEIKELGSQVKELTQAGTKVQKIQHELNIAAENARDHESVHESKMSHVHGSLTRLGEAAAKKVDQCEASFFNQLGSLAATSEKCRAESKQVEDLIDGFAGAEAAAEKTLYVQENIIDQAQSTHKKADAIEKRCLEEASMSMRGATEKLHDVSKKVNEHAVATQKDQEFTAKILESEKKQLEELEKGLGVLQHDQAEVNKELKVVEGEVAKVQVVLQTAKNQRGENDVRVDRAIAQE